MPPDDFARLAEKYDLDQDWLRQNNYNPAQIGQFAEQLDNLYTMEKRQASRLFLQETDPQLKQKWNALAKRKYEEFLVDKRDGFDPKSPEYPVFDEMFKRRQRRSMKDQLAAEKEERESFLARQGPLDWIGLTAATALNEFANERTFGLGKIAGHGLSKILPWTSGEKYEQGQEYLSQLQEDSDVLGVAGMTGKLSAMGRNLKDLSSVGGKIRAGAKTGLGRGMAAALGNFGRPAAGYAGQVAQTGLGFLTYEHLQNLGRAASESVVAGNMQPWEQRMNLAQLRDVTLNTAITAPFLPLLSRLGNKMTNLALKVSPERANILNKAFKDIVGVPAKTQAVLTHGVGKGIEGMAFHLLPSLHSPHNVWQGAEDLLALATGDWDAKRAAAGRFIKSGLAFALIPPGKDTVLAHGPGGAPPQQGLPQDYAGSQQILPTEIVEAIRARTPAERMANEKAADETVAEMSESDLEALSIGIINHQLARDAAAEGAGLEPSGVIDQIAAQWKQQHGVQATPQERLSEIEGELQAYMPGRPLEEAPMQPPVPPRQPVLPAEESTEREYQGQLAEHEARRAAYAEQQQRARERAEQATPEQRRQWAQPGEQLGRIQRERQPGVGGVEELAARHPRGEAEPLNQPLPWQKPTESEQFRRNKFNALMKERAEIRATLNREAVADPNIPAGTPRKPMRPGAEITVSDGKASLEDPYALPEQYDKNAQGKMVDVQIGEDVTTDEKGKKQTAPAYARGVVTEVIMEPTTEAGPDGRPFIRQRMLVEVEHRGDSITFEITGSDFKDGRARPSEGGYESIQDTARMEQPDRFGFARQGEEPGGQGTLIEGQQIPTPQTSQITPGGGPPREPTTEPPDRFAFARQTDEPVIVTDPETGEPVIDPRTGEPQIAHMQGTLFGPTAVPPKKEEEKKGKRTFGKRRKPPDEGEPPAGAAVRGRPRPPKPSGPSARPTEPPAPPTEPGERPPRGEHSEHITGEIWNRFQREYVASLRGEQTPEEAARKVGDEFGTTDGEKRDIARSLLESHGRLGRSDREQLLGEARVSSELRERDILRSMHQLRNETKRKFGVDLKDDAQVMGMQDELFARNEDQKRGDLIDARQKWSNLDHRLFEERQAKEKAIKAEQEEIAKSAPPPTAEEHANRVFGQKRGRKNKVVSKELVQNRRKAAIDPRTGLGSRASFDIARPRIEAQHGNGFVFGDARGFKAINDRRGQVFGDKVIRAMGEKWSEIAKKHGLGERGLFHPEKLFSPAGDEFVASGGTRAQRKAFRDEINRTEVEVDGEKISMRAVMGKTFEQVSERMTKAKEREKKAAAKAAPDAENALREGNKLQEELSGFGDPKLKVGDVVEFDNHKLRLTSAGDKDSNVQYYETTFRGRKYDIKRSDDGNEIAVRSQDEPRMPGEDIGTFKNINDALAAIRKKHHEGAESIMGSIQSSQDVNDKSIEVLNDFINRIGTGEDPRKAADEASKLSKDSDQDKKRLADELLNLYEKEIKGAENELEAGLAFRWRLEQRNIAAEMKRIEDRIGVRYDIDFAADSEEVLRRIEEYGGQESREGMDIQGEWDNYNELIKQFDKAEEKEQKHASLGGISKSRQFGDKRTKALKTVAVGETLTIGETVLTRIKSPPSLLIPGEQYTATHGDLLYNLHRRGNNLMVEVWADIPGKLGKVGTFPTLEEAVDAVWKHRARVEKRHTTDPATGKPTFDWVAKKAKRRFGKKKEIDVEGAADDIFGPGGGGSTGSPSSETSTAGRPSGPKGPRRKKQTPKQTLDRANRTVAKDMDDEARPNDYAWLASKDSRSSDIISAQMKMLEKRIDRHEARGETDSAALKELRAQYAHLDELRAAKYILERDAKRVRDETRIAEADASRQNKNNPANLLVSGDPAIAAQTSTFNPTDLAQQYRDGIQTEILNLKYNRPESEITGREGARLRKLKDDLKTAEGILAKMPHIGEKVQKAHLTKEMGIPSPEIGQRVHYVWVDGGVTNSVAGLVIGTGRAKRSALQRGAGVEGQERRAAGETGEQGAIFHPGRRVTVYTPDGKTVRIRMSDIVDFGPERISDMNFNYTPGDPNRKGVEITPIRWLALQTGIDSRIIEEQMIDRRNELKKRADELWEKKIKGGGLTAEETAESESVKQELESLRSIKISKETTQNPKGTGDEALSEQRRDLLLNNEKKGYYRKKGQGKDAEMIPVTGVEAAKDEATRRASKIRNQTAGSDDYKLEAMAYLVPANKRIALPFKIATKREETAEGIGSLAHPGAATSERGRDLARAEREQEKVAAGKLADVMQLQYFDPGTKLRERSALSEDEGEQYDFWMRRAEQEGTQRDLLASREQESKLAANSFYPIFESKNGREAIITHRTYRDDGTFRDGRELLMEYTSNGTFFIRTFMPKEADAWAKRNGFGKEFKEWRKNARDDRRKMRSENKTIIDKMLGDQVLQDRFHNAVFRMEGIIERDQIPEALNKYDRMAIKWLKQNPRPSKDDPEYRRWKGEYQTWMGSTPRGEAMINREGIVPVGSSAEMVRARGEADKGGPLHQMALDMTQWRDPITGHKFRYKNGKLYLEDGTKDGTVLGVGLGGLPWREMFASFRKGAKFTGDVHAGVDRFVVDGTSVASGVVFDRLSEWVNHPDRGGLIGSFARNFWTEQTNSPRLRTILSDRHGRDYQYAKEIREAVQPLIDVPPLEMIDRLRKAEQGDIHPSLAAYKKVIDKLGLRLVELGLLDRKQYEHFSDPKRFWIHYGRFDWKPEVIKQRIEQSEKELKALEAKKDVILKRSREGREREYDEEIVAVNRDIEDTVDYIYGMKKANRRTWLAGLTRIYKGNHPIDKMTAGEVRMLRRQGFTRKKFHKNIDDAMNAGLDTVEPWKLLVDGAYAEARAIAKAEMLHKIAADPQFVRNASEAPESWVDIKGDKYSKDRFWQPFIGKKIHPATFDMISSNEPSQNGWSQLWDYTHGLAKASMTIAHLPNWTTQLLGNHDIMLYAGVPILSVPRRLGSGFMAMLGKGKYGHLREQFRKWNWTSHATDAERELSMALDRGSLFDTEMSAHDEHYMGMSGWEVFQNGIKDISKANLKRGLRGVVLSARSMYRSLDAAARIGTYAHYVERGMTPEAAREKVDKWYDLTHIPKGWKAARRWGLDSFASIKVAMSRNVPEMAARAPIVMLQKALFAGALGAALRMIYGMSEEEYEERKDASIPANAPLNEWLDRATAMPVPTPHGLSFMDMQRYSAFDPALSLIPGVKPLVKGIGGMFTGKGFVPVDEHGVGILDSVAELIGGRNVMLSATADYVLDRDRYSPGGSYRQRMDEPGIFGQTGLIRANLEHGPLPALLMGAIPWAGPAAGPAGSSILRATRRFGQTTETGGIAGRARTVPTLVPRSKAPPGEEQRTDMEQGARDYDMFDAMTEFLGYNIAPQDKHQRAKERIVQQNRDEIVKTDTGFRRRRFLKPGTPETKAASQQIRHTQDIKSVQDGIRILGLVNKYSRAKPENRENLMEQIKERIGTADAYSRVVSALWSAGEYAIVRDLEEFTQAHEEAFQEKPEKTLPYGYTGD